MRQSIIVITSKLSNSFHFTSGCLSTESMGFDLWIARNELSIFEQIETIMIKTNQANNLTLITKIRDSNDCSDLEITFNRS